MNRMRARVFGAWALGCMSTEMLRTQSKLCGAVWRCRAMPTASLHTLSLSLSLSRTHRHMGKCPEKSNELCGGWQNTHLSYTFFALYRSLLGFLLKVPVFRKRFVLVHAGAKGSCRLDSLGSSSAKNSRWVYCLGFSSSAKDSCWVYSLGLSSFAEASCWVYSLGFRLRPKVPARFTP